MTLEVQMKITAILPWFGSKRILAPRIVEQLGPHRSYWEPFCGSMAVLLAKPPCSQETVNDLHGDLVNLARVIQHEKHGPWLYRQLRRTLVHEEIFAEAEAETVTGEPLEGRTPYPQRAYWYFIASWLGRGGVIGTTKGTSGKAFCVRYTSNGGIQGTRFCSAVDSIPTWRARLRNVTILRRNGIDLLERVEDHDGQCLYVDPPYIEKGAEYINDFAAEDHDRLAELLRRFRRARVVVSYYQHPKLAELYPGWTQIDCTVAKSLAVQGQRGKRGKAKEEAPEVLLVNGPAIASEGLF